MTYTMQINLIIGDSFHQWN